MFPLHLRHRLDNLLLALLPDHIGDNVGAFKILLVNRGHHGISLQDKRFVHLLLQLLPNLCYLTGVVNCWNQKTPKRRLTPPHVRYVWKTKSEFTFIHVVIHPCALHAPKTCIKTRKANSCVPFAKLESSLSRKHFKNKK